MKYNFLLLIFILGAFKGASQDDRRLFLPKISESIIIDGSLDEKAWSNITQYARDFWQYFPTDSLLAENQTEIKMCFDDHNLYIGIICHSPGGDYVVPSLKRDFSAWNNDNITLLIDTYGEGSNAFMFGINPEGVKREGLISNGGISFRDFSTGWDNKWRAETIKYDDKWVSEIAIPFSTLRFNKGQKIWKFNSYRFEMQGNERTTWQHIPRNQPIFGLGYMGEMEFEKKITAKSSKVTIIPYAITSRVRDIKAGKSPTYDYNAGVDAKVAISSGLNLDLTVNPDFSQVEVDRQVTNLSRFQIFFPERRQFFLENADLFSSFGFSRTNPFFSRRIGISRDTSTGQFVQNTILGGARLSGKLNSQWRLGLLSMVTQKDQNAARPAVNYTVGALQKKIGDRSNIGFIMVNRQSINPSADDAIDRYNRVLGIDYNLATTSNIWNGKVFVHKSFSVDQKYDSWAHGLRLRYNPSDFRFDWAHEYVGKNYDAQVGFVNRTGFFKISPEISYAFFPKTTIFHRLVAAVEWSQVWTNGHGKSDQDIRAGVRFELKNRGGGDFNANRSFVYLFRDFDPTGTGSEKLPAGSTYTYYHFDAGLYSDSAHPFTWQFDPLVGQYFGGMRYRIQGSFGYRVEPWGKASISYNYNIFDMPYLDELRSTFLLGTKFDLTLNKKMFFTTFIQYNSQSENTNINARFQWRFAPVSDFFLVYSENYFAGQDPSDQFAFDIKDRSIVAKLNYWL